MKALKTFFAAMCCVAAILLTPEAAFAQLDVEIGDIQSERTAGGGVTYEIDFEMESLDGDDYYIPAFAAVWDAIIFDQIQGFEFIFSDSAGFWLSGVDYHANISSTADIDVNQLGHSFFVVRDDEEFILTITVPCQGNEVFPNHRIRLSEVNYFEQLNNGAMQTRSLSPASRYTSDVELTCIPIPLELPISDIQVEANQVETTLPSWAMHNGYLEATDLSFEVDEEIISTSIEVTPAGASAWSHHMNMVVVHVSIFRDGSHTSYEVTNTNGGGTAISLGVLLPGDDVSVWADILLGGCLNGLTPTDMLSFQTILRGAANGVVGSVEIGTGNQIFPLIPENPQGIELGIIGDLDGDMMGLISQIPLQTSASNIMVTLDYEDDNFDVTNSSLRFALLSPTGVEYSQYYQYDMNDYWGISRGNDYLELGTFYDNGGEPMPKLGEAGIWKLAVQTTGSSTFCSGIELKDEIQFLVEDVEAPTGIRDIRESTIRMNQVGGQVTLSHTTPITVALHDALGRLASTQTGTSIEFELSGGINFLSVFDGKKAFSARVSNLR